MNSIAFDMDHTLWTFPHEEALQEMRSHLIEKLDPRAGAAVADFVDRCFDNFFKRAQGLLYDQSIEHFLEDYISSIQKPERTSDLRWSRELWVYAAQWAVQTDASISPQFAVEAAGVYWQSIATHARLHEDVEQFFDSAWWQNGQWQLVLVTSSDARLYADDGQLVYDPEYSDQKKRERILPRLLVESNNNIFVGDPISKPRPEFWHSVLANIGHEPKSATNGHNTDIIVMVGDSYRADIEGVRPWGGIPFLIDREYQFRLEEVPEAQGIIRSFAELPGILDRIEKEKL